LCLSTTQDSDAILLDRISGVLDNCQDGLAIQVTVVLVGHGTVKSLAKSKQIGQELKAVQLSLGQQCASTNTKMKWSGNSNVPM